jgi:hypothetical protein
MSDETADTQPPPCDQEIFDKGLAVCTFVAPSRITEAWVVKVREKSGQRVDWHHSGGRVNMLYLGDYAKVRAAVEELLPELNAACLEHRRNDKDAIFKDLGVEAFAFFGEHSRGLYRQGDFSAPEGYAPIVLDDDES